MAERSPVIEADQDIEADQEPVAELLSTMAGRNPTAMAAHRLFAVVAERGALTSRTGCRQLARAERTRRLAVGSRHRVHHLFHHRVHHPLHHHRVHRAGLQDHSEFFTTRTHRLRMTDP